MIYVLCNYCKYINSKCLFCYSIIWAQITSSVCVIGFFTALSCQTPLVINMTHWTADDLVKEIIDMQSLYKLRPDSFVVGRMQTVLINKFQACQMSPSVVLKLLSTIQDSELPEEMKEALMETVDQQASSYVAGPLRLSTMPQTLKTIYYYLSISEMNTLLQMSTTMDAIALISARLRIIGLKSLKECTKKNVTAFLVHLALRRGEAMPSVQDIYRLAGQVANAFSVCTVQAQVAGYATYPPTPQELGDEFLRKAYNDGDVPDITARSGLATCVNALMKQCYVRNTGAPFKPSKVETSSRSSAAEQAMVASATMEKFGTLLTGLMEKAKLLDDHSLPSSSSGTWPGARSILLSPSTAMGLSCNGDVTKALVPSSTTSGGSGLEACEAPKSDEAAATSQDKTLEEWEEQAYQKLPRKQAL